MIDTTLLEQLAYIPANSSHLSRCLNTMDENLQAAYRRQDMDKVKEILAQGRQFANEIAVARV